MTLPQHQIAPDVDEFVQATSLESAVRSLADGEATPVAGATDLWVQKDSVPGRVGHRLVGIRRVPELGGLAEFDGRIRMGALVTLTEILESELLAAKIPVLPETAARFGSVQIRNVATVGGNIVNASPAADLVLPLLCLDAEVELASWTGTSIVTRRMRLQELFVSPGQTRREPHELLTAVELELPAVDIELGFYKTGPRPALEIALVAMALAYRVVEGTLRHVRIAFGAVAPTPLRCARTERVLEGASVDELDIDRALDALEGEIRPIGDHRASEWYRCHLARQYLESALRDVGRD